MSNLTASAGCALSPLRGKRPTDRFDVGLARLVAITVDRHQSPVGSLDGVSKSTSAGPEVDVIDDHAVGSKIPALAVIVVEDCPEAEFVAIGRVTADLSLIHI